MNELRLALPATSANLGPGFDALALALDLYLEIEAREMERRGEEPFSITADGRNSEICGRLENNLLLETYKNVLTEEQVRVVPLAIRMNNGIPLGMGCGSSAAVRLAGVALASHFGSLGWSDEKIVETAARLEGHPDNVAGCWYGGLTIAALHEGRLTAVSIPPPSVWTALLVFPEKPLATSAARSVLPQTYSREDAVFNLQNVALLTAAFALQKPEILAQATIDRFHQPYRKTLCPLFSLLSPLAGKDGILSVTLSGAGPAALLLLDGVADSATVKQKVLSAAHSAGQVELVEAGLSGGGAKVSPAAGAVTKAVITDLIT